MCSDITGFSIYYVNMNTFNGILSSKIWRSKYILVFIQSFNHVKEGDAVSILSGLKLF